MKEITIFAKKRTTSDGRKSFYSYLTTLTRKDGTPCTCSVKFVAPAENPDPVDCPMNIQINLSDCNLSVENYLDRNGETKESHKLWVKAYKPGTPYQDHSMDDFI